MSKVILDTLQSKVEFMVLGLGGKPDQEKQEDQRNQDQFDKITVIIKDKMKEIKDKLKERKELIENS